MQRNNSGFILITVLWTLAILSLIALSLSKSSSLDLTLIRNRIGKIKADTAARSGISYAEHLLAKNKSPKDTLYASGIIIPEGQTPEDLFKNIKISDDAHFDIRFSGESYGVSKIKRELYGFEDEHGKININALDSSNYLIFSKLLEQAAGINSTDAQEIAAAVVDWKNTGSIAMRFSQKNIKGAKDNYYMSRSIPYKCKNAPFDRPEELLFIKGMSPEIFKQIRQFITIFPKQPAAGIRINFNTAPDAVIAAAVAAFSPGIAEEEIQKGLARHRNGPDNIPSTPDDGMDDRSMFSATQELHMNSLRTNQGVEQSEYYRVSSVGTDEGTGIRSFITAVIYRPSSGGTTSIVSWNKN